MKKIWGCFLVVFPFLLSAQSPGHARQKLFDRDSIAKKIEQFKESTIKADSVRKVAEVKANAEQIISLQKQNRERQKKAAIARIAIGAFFLALLVFGLIRGKRKHKG
jgi:hypothetical protein